MVCTLSAVVLLAASVSASVPASFESVVDGVRAQVQAQSESNAKAAAASLGAQLDDLTWGLQDAAQNFDRRRSNLRVLMSRVDAFVPGRPQDPNLGWDLQLFTQDLDTAAQNSRYRLNDLSALSVQIRAKDPALAASAQRLADAASAFQSGVHWFVFDEGFDTADLERMGYFQQEMDLDQDSRDLDRSSQALLSAAQALLAKIR